MEAVLGRATDHKTKSHFVRRGLGKDIGSHGNAVFIDLVRQNTRHVLIIVTALFGIFPVHVKRAAADPSRFAECLGNF